MQTLSKFILLFIHFVLLLVWADYSGSLISQNINIFAVFGILLTYILGSVSVVVHMTKIAKFIKNKNK